MDTNTDLSIPKQFLIYIYCIEYIFFAFTWWCHKTPNPLPSPTPRQTQHTPKHTAHSYSSGYARTDKVCSLSDSPSAPRTSDTQKIVMPDLFDMKRWEGNDCRECMIEMNIQCKKNMKGDHSTGVPDLYYQLQKGWSKRAELYTSYHQSRRIRI